MKRFAQHVGLRVANVSEQERRSAMEAELATLIQQVRQGETGAYEPIVRRFQDMAVGYGYARLGDMQLAEDAAQEAFITAYIALPSLKNKPRLRGCRWQSTTGLCAKTGTPPLRSASQSPDLFKGPSRSR
jgi:hypothetical protein